MHLAGIVGRSFDVERDVGQQINLVEHEQIGLEKYGRIFEWLVFAFGDAQHHDLGRLAEIVTGGTNQVADVFNQQKIEVFKTPVGQVALDHARIQVASTAGRDLLNREIKPLQPVGIVFCLNISC